MKIMALSLWQPWADMIALPPHWKKIETRPWKPTREDQRSGPLLICAAKRKVDPNDVKLYQDRQFGSEHDQVGRKILSSTYTPRYGLGLAIAWLDQIRPMVVGDWWDACFSPDTQPEDVERKQAWCLEEITELQEPFPVTGKQGLFEVELTTPEALEIVEHLIGKYGKDSWTVRHSTPPRPMKRRKLRGVSL